MTDQAASTSPPVTVDSPKPIGPTTAAERIELIDVVRGVALFGILAANMRGFAGPAIAYFDPSLVWTSMPDRMVQAVIDTLVQGKFITIFSFLFGLGFAVQLSRADEKGAKFVGFYVRRMVVLALIGLVHGIYIWFGDILLGYASVGLFLLLFKRRRDKTLIAWAAVLYFVPVVLMAMGVMAIELTGKEMKGPDTSPATVTLQLQTFSSGTWSEIQEQRRVDVIANNWRFLPLVAFQLLALFLLGALAWRRGLFSPKPENVPRYRKVMIVGFAIGLTGNLAASVIKWVLDPPMFPLTPTMLGVTTIQMFSTVPLSAGYVCAIIVLFHDERWRRRLHVFNAVGRTALSNYLLQSVIGTLIFYSYGLGFFGDAGPAFLLIPTVVIFGLQIVASNWWLARFRFGPAEWLWRSLTYGRLQPMKRVSA